MNISQETLSELRRAYDATMDSTGGEFGYSSEIEGCTREEGVALLERLHAIRNAADQPMVWVEWDTEVNGKKINDDQFGLNEWTRGLLEEKSEALEPAAAVHCFAGETGYLHIVTSGLIAELNRTVTGASFTKLTCRLIQVEGQNATIEVQLKCGSPVLVVRTPDSLLRMGILGAIQNLDF